MYSLIIEMRDVVIGDLRFARIGKLLFLLDDINPGGKSDQLFVFVVSA